MTLHRTSIEEYPSVAALRAESGIAPTPNDFVFIPAAGFFQWNPTSTLTDDGANVIAQTNLATGRWLAASPAPTVQPYVPVNAGAYTLSDADSGRTIELSGVCTLNIPATLSAAFRSCFLMQMDANTSNIVPAVGVTLVSDSGQNATVASAQYAMYEIRRTSNGTMLLRSGA